MSESITAAGPWTLHLGIHCGTCLSRDAERPKQFPSLNACRTEAESAARTYRGLGCKIWFGYATGPAGEHVSLLRGEPYE